MNKINKLVNEFECKKCGKCCNKYGRIEIRFSDVERIEKAPVDSYGIIYDKSGIPHLVTKDDGSCYYYDEVYGCGIHRYKPMDCKIYPYMLYDGWFWRKTCLKERETEEYKAEKLFLITEQEKENEELRDWQYEGCMTKQTIKNKNMEEKKL